jgi:putative transposase
MSYVNILLHVVWSTKYRNPILLNPGREILLRHIFENSKTKEVCIDFIGGYLDHVHCLVKLGRTQSISNVVQLVKGESSRWANKNGIFAQHLEWAEDYYAGSINPSTREQLRNYIKNQEDHHSRITYSEELREFGFDN